MADPPPSHPITTKPEAQHKLENIICQTLPQILDIETLLQNFTVIDLMASSMTSVTAYETHKELLSSLQPLLDQVTHFLDYELGHLTPYLSDNNDSKFKLWNAHRDISKHHDELRRHFAEMQRSLYGFYPYLESEDRRKGFVRVLTGLKAEFVALMRFAPLAPGWAKGVGGVAF